MKSRCKLWTGLAVCTASLALGNAVLSFESNTNARVGRALREPSSGPYGNYWLSTDARLEIRALGTNALPALLRAIDQNRLDSRLDRWLRRTHLETRVAGLGYMPRWEIAEHVVDAFGVLGPLGTPAVKELEKRVQDRETAETAVRCLIEVGRQSPEAVAALQEATRSSNRVVRHIASDVAWLPEQ